MNIKYNVQNVIDCLEEVNEINTYIIFVKFIDSSLQPNKI